jgi:hypothetical protein
MKKEELGMTSRDYKDLGCNPDVEEALFDPNTEVIESGQEIVVHWINKHGIYMDVKTRKGGLIHKLWLQELEKRNKKKLEQDNVIEIQPEVTTCPEKTSSSEDQSSR